MLIESLATKTAISLLSPIQYRPTLGIFGTRLIDPSTHAFTGLEEWTRGHRSKTYSPSARTALVKDEASPVFGEADTAPCTYITEDRSNSVFFFYFS